MLVTQAVNALGYFIIAALSTPPKHNSESEYVNVLSKLSRIGDDSTYSTRHLSIISCRKKAWFGVCRLVVVVFKFVTDKVALSLKKMVTHTVGYRFPSFTF